MDRGADGLQGGVGRQRPDPDDPGADEVAMLGSRGLDVEAVAEEIELEGQDMEGHPGLGGGRRRMALRVRGRADRQGQPAVAVAQHGHQLDHADDDLVIGQGGNAVAKRGDGLIEIGPGEGIEGMAVLLGHRLGEKIDVFPPLLIGQAAGAGRRHLGGRSGSGSDLGEEQEGEYEEERGRKLSEGHDHSFPCREGQSIPCLQVRRREQGESCMRGPFGDGNSESGIGNLMQS